MDFLPGFEAHSAISHRLDRGRWCSGSKRAPRTAYRAAYLELAMRLGIPLASKDADLCDAAEHLDVSVPRAA
jgi:hypothetical protein